MDIPLICAFTPRICTKIFMFWIYTGKTCTQLCNPEKLDEWVFSGRGAFGNLFRNGEFPYSLTGSMAKFHGTKITKEFVAHFIASISAYNHHPICIITLKSVFDGTKHASMLYSRLAELHAQGPFVFHSYIVVLEKVESTLYVQIDTDKERELRRIISAFNISTIPWAVNKSHLVKIVLFRTTTNIAIASVDFVFEECINMAVLMAVTGVDAILIRLFIPDIHKSFIPANLIYS